MADKIKANDYTSINQSAESVSSDTTNTESTLNNYEQFEESYYIKFNRAQKGDISSTGEKNQFYLLSLESSYYL